MNNRWLMAGIALSLLATSACGKKVKLEDLDEELASVTCEKIYECCSQEEIDAAGNFLVDFETQDQCESAYDNLLGLLFTPALKSAVENGRADYDPKAAGDCLAQYNAVSCEEVAAAEGEMACAEIIIPLVEDGGECKQDFECKGGTCDLSGDDGICRQLPGDGEPCLESEMDGFTFETCDEELVCIDGTCVAPKAEGADCASGSECQSGMCDFQTSKCAPLKAEGEDCFYGGECASGACDEETMTCTAAGSADGCGLL